MDTIDLVYNKEIFLFVLYYSMSEIEIGSIDTGTTNNEWSGEVSQEDLIRVNEWLWEARKYRGKIGSSIASNSKLAQFITYLVVTIDQQEFREYLDCFWIANPLGESTFLVKMFIACMLPLYREKADELWLSTEFTLDYHFDVTFKNYILYIQQLFAHDTESWKVHEKDFIRFITMVIRQRSISLWESESLSMITIHALQPISDNRLW